jgi:hypothetical protein
MKNYFPLLHVRTNKSGLTTIARILLFTVFIAMFNCQKPKDVDPAENLISPTDAKKVGEALIMPSGTETKTGTPPSPSTSAQAPKVSSTTTEVPTANGATETTKVNYSNLNGSIGGAYAKVENSPTYYDIPLRGNAPSSGSISIPIGIPDNIDSGSFTLIISIYDANGRVSNVIRIRYTITRFTQPAAGKGSVNIGGKTYTATAVCDINFGGYGNAYGILVNETQLVMLYNLRQGSNQIYDAIDDDNFDIERNSWAAYFDGTEFFFSKSGSATYNGKVVSTTAQFDNFDGKRVSISASGNCQ